MLWQQLMIDTPLCLEQDIQIRKVVIDMVVKDIVLETWLPWESAKDFSYEYIVL